MALQVSNIKGAIVSRSGSILKASERLSTGTALGTPDTVHDFGEVKDSQFRDKTPFTPRYNEAGEKVANEQGERDTGFSATLMQRDGQTIDDLRNEVRNKYYLTMHVLSQSQAVNGKTQYMFAFGQIRPDVEFSLPGGEIPMAFEGLILDTAITLTPGELSSWTGNTTALPATVTIPAGDWMKIVEVTTT